ncbi:MAG: gephyrin-like molybdotransferase Glp, partial [Candidatus Phosphoribacter sp.]
MAEHHGRADRSVAEHLDAVMAGSRALPGVLLPLEQARGLVAAELVHSLVDLPGFDNSAMDGYAVRVADIADAGAAHPVMLPVVADLGAGSAAGPTLGPGQSIRIMTGAMVPDGAEAIVWVEDTDAGMPIVAIHAPAVVGASIRRRGEDLAAGAVVLRPGSVIDARRIGLLAAAGHASVVVHPRARVAVLSTGAELVEPGAPLRPGQIYDSNSHLLAAAVEAAGARTAYRGHVGDDPEQVRALIDRLAGEVDVVVTSGGVSMGVHDVVKAVLRERPGVEFVTVAMQPGRPQGFGRLQPTGGGMTPGVGGDRDGGRQVLFFGLPGNPVSAFVSFEMFVRPLLRRLAGREPATRATVRSRLVTP